MEEDKSSADLKLIQFRVWMGQSMFYRNDLNSTYFELDHVLQSIEMLATGIKDKNGKEIYEGDIVELDYCYGKTKGIVCFGKYEADGLYEGGVDVIGFFVKRDKECDSLGDSVDSYYTIIGNIYENPELLA